MASAYYLGSAESTTADFLLVWLKSSRSDPHSVINMQSITVYFKYNLINVFMNAFLESFGERKFNVSIMLKETMYMIFLSAHSEFKAFDP